MVLLSLDFLFIPVRCLQVICYFLRRLFTLNHLELGPSASLFGQMHANRVNTLAFLMLQFVLKHLAQLYIDSLNKLYDSRIFCVVLCVRHVKDEVPEKHFY